MKNRVETGGVRGRTVPPVPSAQPVVGAAERRSGFWGGKRAAGGWRAKGQRERTRLESYLRSRRGLNERKHRSRCAEEGGGGSSSLAFTCVTNTCFWLIYQRRRITGTTGWTGTLLVYEQGKINKKVINNRNQSSSLDWVPTQYLKITNYEHN